MNPGTLVRRSVRYYWRTNAAVVLGVSIAAAVLAGALMVGVSVRASLRDLVVHPPKFDHPLDRIGGTIRAAHGVIVLENVSALYGKDVWAINSARIPIDEDLPAKIQVRELNGVLVFRAPSPAYPHPLTTTIEALAPDGTFVIGGNFTIDDIGRAARPNVDFRMLVSTDRIKDVYFDAHPRARA